MVFMGHDGSHRTGVAVCVCRGVVCQKLTLGIPMENLTASRSNHTHGEWAIACAAVKCTCLFKEFNDYEWFVIGKLVAQSDPSQHNCVLDLDLTIRL